MKRYLIDFFIIALLFTALSYIMVSWEQSESAWLNDYTQLSEDYDKLAIQYLDLQKEFIKLLDKEDQNDNTIQERKTEL